MLRILSTTAVAAALLITSTGTALAQSVTVGGTTVTTVGAWVKPTSCSQFPVEYTGVAVDQVASIDVLDAVTRSTLGSALVIGKAPGSGRTNVQVCSFSVEGTTRLLVSLEVSGQGAADSAEFGWSPKPNTVRCVNKSTYNIKEYTGKKCPAGWVKR